MRNRLMRTTFAKANQYPTGMMNVCVCGQVVLAPDTEHDFCRWCDVHNDYVKNCENN
jgi:hypothetical protein